MNASCGSRKSAECTGCWIGQASHARAAITRRPTWRHGFTESIFRCESLQSGGTEAVWGERSAQDGECRPAPFCPNGRCSWTQAFGRSDCLQYVPCAHILDKAHESQ